MAMDFVLLHYQNSGKEVWVNLDQVVTIDTDPDEPDCAEVGNSNGRTIYVRESVDDIVKFIQSERRKHNGCWNKFDV